MKHKFSLSGAFRDRKFKYSGTATVLVVAVVAVTLIINLLCSLLPYRIDVTANKIYSISNKTLSVLKTIEKDIDIYFLYPAGTENGDVMEIAARYAAASDHINTKQIDPIANPGFVNDYMMDDDKSSTTPTSGSVIVECKENDKFVVLTSKDMYNYTYSEDGETVTAVYFAAEQAFTSAITAVTNKEKYNVGVLTGHNEDELPKAIVDMLEKQFFNIYEINLKTQKEIPITTKVLIVNQPEFDILEDEKKIIMDFLDANDTCGNVIFLLGKATGETPNIDSIMYYYGLVLGKETIYEEDASKYVGGTKYALQLPYKSVGPASLAGVSQGLYLNKAKPIYTDRFRKENIGHYEISATSDKSWASADPKSGTIEKGEDDISGPFLPIIGVTEFNHDYTHQSRMMVVNCANFMLTTQEMMNNFANDEIFYSALFWCLDSKSAMVTITPKYFITSTHTLATSGLYIYGAVIGILIPFLVLGTGIFVYFKRRNL